MAAFWFNDAGTWRKAKNVWFNDAGIWRTAKSIWFNDAGIWRKVFASLIATVSPSTVTGSGSGRSGSVVGVTTGAATVTPIGGSGSYTYAWSALAGNMDSSSANSPTAATTTFWVSMTAGTNGTLTDYNYWQCTVTDTASGATAVAGVTLQTSASGTGVPL